VGETVGPIRVEGHAGRVARCQAGPGHRHAGPHHLSEKGPIEIFTLAGIRNSENETGDRSKKNLVPKFASNDQRKFSFSVRTAERSNRLPDKIKQAANQEDFRKRLKNSNF
jgi:hypothetical protein